MTSSWFLFFNYQIYSRHRSYRVNNTYSVCEIKRRYLSPFLHKPDTIPTWAGSVQFVSSQYIFSSVRILSIHFQFISYPLNTFSVQFVSSQFIFSSVRTLSIHFQFSSYPRNTFSVQFVSSQYIQLTRTNARASS